MKIWIRPLVLAMGGLTALSSTAHAQPSSTTSNNATVMWTIAGAGGGFGIGLWAGLTKFDDAINSDRKVWTTAAVGAAVGAVSGYLIGRSRAARSQSTPSSTTRSRTASVAFRRLDGRDAFGPTTGLPPTFSFRSSLAADVPSAGR